MAIDPRQAITLASALRELYGSAEDRVLRIVARRLAAGIDQPGWAERKAAELTSVRVELERAIAELDVAGPEQLRLLVEQAHRVGAVAAADALGGALAVRSNPAAVQALVEATAGQLRNTHLPILRTATDAYRATVAEAAGFGVTGVETRRETARRAMRRFADRGVTGFVDSAGRHWDLSSYTEMATRSALGQAHLTGHLDQLTARGHDLVRISDSPDECKLCRPHEGRIYSIGGVNPKYPALADARGQGLFHPNCTHSLAPYVPGLSRPFGRTADPVGNRERAQHRSNEHQIRHWKRRESVASAMGDQRGQAQAAAKVGEWQAEQRRFIADTGRRRDYAREAAGAAR
jgi:hypothetical protein